jgi:DNA-binding NtrC family response regulator
VESAVVMTPGPLIGVEDLPPTLRQGNDDGWIRIPLGSTLEDAEKIVIRGTLSAQRGNKSKTADVLGIGRKTLHRKLADYGAGYIGVSGGGQDPE